MSRLPVHIPFPTIGEPNEAEKRELLRLYPQFHLWILRANKLVNDARARLGNTPEVIAAQDQVREIATVLSQADQEMDGTIELARSRGRWEPSWPQTVREFIAADQDIQGFAAVWFLPLMIAVIIALAAVPLWLLLREVFDGIAGLRDSLYELAQAAQLPGLNMGQSLLVWMVGGALLAWWIYSDISNRRRRKGKGK